MRMHARTQAQEHAHAHAHVHAAVEGQLFVWGDMDFERTQQRASSTPVHVYLSSHVSCNARWIVAQQLGQHVSCYNWYAAMGLGAHAGAHTMVIITYQHIISMP